MHVNTMRSMHWRTDMCTATRQQLPKDDIWVVFEDVPGGDWYVGSTTVAALRKKSQK